MTVLYRTDFILTNPLIVYQLFIETDGIMNLIRHFEEVGSESYEQKVVWIKYHDPIEVT